MSGDGVFCKTKSAWKTGVRLRSRGGWISSTRRSKGRSWFAYASRLLSFTRSNNVEKFGFPLASIRMTNTLTKQPIRSSNSMRLRLAMGEPTRRSVWFVYRLSRIARAARSTMYNVAPSRRLSSWRALRVCAGTATYWRSPRCVSRGGRE